MKKRNGFTLIELLAVIVILAVMALIAVPRIIEILNKSRISAAEDSTYGIVEAAESYVADFMLQNHGVIPENLEFTCSSTGCSLTTTLEGYNTENLTSLEFKGKKPTSGTITVSDSGNTVEAKGLVISGYKCNYKDEKASCGDSGEVVEEKTNYREGVILKEDFEDKGITGGYEGVLAIVYLDPTDLSATCNEDNLGPITNDGPNTGCMKWYAYKDDGTNYTMIADHNITGAVAWYAEDRDNTKGPKEVLDSLRNATLSWDSKLVEPGRYEASWTYDDQPHSYTIDYSTYGNRARLISAEEIYEIIGKETKDLNSISTGYMDTNCNGSGKCSTGGNKYAWLFDNTNNCTNYGCNVEQTGTVGYWTSSAGASNSGVALRVDTSGNLYINYVTSAAICGVRPVIIVSKSDLLQ